MRRKTLAVAVMAAAMIGLTACGSAGGVASSAAATSGSAAASAATTTTTAAAKTASAKKNVDFDGSGLSDTGDGTFTLRGPGGSTEGGATLTVYADSSTAMMQIEYDTKNVNGNALSYVYIDGKQTDKAQVGTSQHVLDLSGDALKVGTHTVELVQFENDDPAGTVTTYKSAQYEIKSK